MRAIRNSGREWMTGTTRFISEHEQAAWWQNKPDSLRAWLFYSEYFQHEVGFGMIREQLDNLWGTLAVLPQYRGYGFGTQIYRGLIEEVNALGRPLFLLIKDINLPSYRAARRAGFEPADYDQNGTMTLVWRPS